MTNKQLSKPFTARTGKDIRRLLDEKSKPVQITGYHHFTGSTEIVLAAIWKGLLGHENLSRNDDFFHIGGNSLKAVQMVSRIADQFKTDISLTNIFLQPTIAQIAILINKNQNGKTSSSALISIQERPVAIPLSYNQGRLWFIDQLEGSVHYHFPVVLKLEGNLSCNALAHALKTVVNRHESLRSVILHENENIHQQVMAADAWDLKMINGSVYEKDKEGLEVYIRQIINERFDLSKDYMLRASLIQIADTENVLVIVMHHIASDGWSLSAMAGEVNELYKSYVEGRQPDLPLLNIQYADFAIWQRNYLQGTVLNNKIEYWKNQLEDVSPLQLPTDFSRPAVQSVKGTVSRFIIDKDITDAIQKLGYEEEATLFMTLLAAFKMLLYRYTGQDDICVGTPTAGRQQKETEALIGFFVNTLALRTNVDKEDSFKSLLAKVKKTTIEAYEHQDMPFEKVVETVVKERDMSRSPLFQVMFVLQNTPDNLNLHLPGLQASGELWENSTSKFDFSFYLTQTASGLEGFVEYCTDLYREETIGRLINHYKELLSAVAKKPAEKIGHLQMLTRAEDHQLLVEFNNTKTAAVHKSIADIFTEQATAKPDAIATQFEQEQLTYSELNSRANQLARYLIDKGITKEMLVPICIEKSNAMIVGIMGILKTGAAFVPVDPEYPAERINYMLSDTDASIILSSVESRVKLQKFESAEIILLDKDWLLISEMPATDPGIAVPPESLAYVIYTSGSTGLPKGVMIEHRSVVNLLDSITGIIDFTLDSAFLSVTTFSFDICYLEFFVPLINGGKLIIIPREIATDGFELTRSIIRYKATHLQATPATWQLLLDAGWKNKEGIKMLIGGEAVKEEIKNALTPLGEVFNLYGPTETTIWSVGKKLLADEKVLIGKPLSNTSIYIFSEELELLPVGVAGEICIGGAGLARGYLNRSDLTDQKFIPNPVSGYGKSLIYRTGDLGKWMPDGNIEYVGRIDDQVKIRGHRIEPGEIETVLLQSGLVKQAVISARETAHGDKHLVAYVVCAGNFNKDLAHTYLSQHLPDYMLPALWVELKSLPLTLNGKIDKKLLPDPIGANIATAVYTPPGTDTEKKLATLWQRLLNIERISIYDNFFELGGHSLLAMRLASAIRKELQVEVAIKSLLTHSTIAALAAHIETRNTGLLLPPIEVQPRPAYIPLSYSQERLWFIDRLRGSVQYYLPSTLRLKGNLNKDALAFALQYIVNRHEILRTVILEEQGKIYQTIKEKDGWVLNFINDKAYQNNQEALQQYIQQLVKAPFDLSRDYMLRADLISIEQQDHLLVVTMHHIASDGWSTAIIVKELSEIYTALEKGHPVELSPLPIQYADYAIWQRNYLQGEVLDKKLSYWKDKLQGVTTLKLPLDYERPAIQSKRGAIFRFDIDKELTEQLGFLSRQQGTTLFMTLLAGFKVMLHRYSGQDDICIGTPIAGRSHQEVETLIGFFINSLALRSDLSNDPSFTNLLQQVKNTMLEAYANQDAPFEKVVEAVSGERDMSSNPLFQLLFTMQNTPQIPKLRLGEITLSVEEYENNTSQLDIICNITETNHGLQGVVVYCSDLFTESTIERMMGHFKNLLGAIIQSPQQNIGSLPMLSPKEQHQLLVEFNDTKVESPQQKTIITLFEEQVAKTPDNVAGVFEDELLTYQQLNEKANQLARYLKLQGIKEEQLIPVCIERSLDMLVIILGILKAGATYVPIDPAYPEERISYLLEDTRASLVISNSNSGAKLPNEPAIRVLMIDDYNELMYTSRQSTQNLQKDINLHQLAYVIYTSGSTGKPKGVMIEHRSLSNYLLNNKTSYISEGTSVSGSFVHLPYTFDASLTGMFMPLLSGKLVVIGSRLSIDVFEDSNLQKYAPYDFIKITPAHLELLQPKIRALNGNLLTSKLVIGGEALLPGQFNYFIEKGLNITIVNEYGPTEATVGCSVYCFNTVKEQGNITNNKSISIGKPIDNVELYILSDTNSLLPIGVPGELCIGGAGLARGYLNRPDLTAERFIRNPFNKEGESRLYKTGDVASWSAAGNITYLGRKDEQVKIRGYRVELGEIESVLKECPFVRQAVVLAKENKDKSKRLVAFVVTAEVFKKEEILSYLVKGLPDYMIPMQWVALDSLPLTVHGKIDRKALPDPDVSALLSKQYVAPGSEMEKALVEIWQELLDIETVGINDNFFELGGHSLMVIKMLSVIKKRFNLSIPIQVVFKFSTIHELANYMEWENGTEQEHDDAIPFELINI